MLPILSRILLPRLGTVAAPAATRLYNNVTEQWNLVNGAFGAFVPVSQSGNPVVPTLATPGSRFKFIMKRDRSNDTSVMFQREYEETDWITAKCLDDSLITFEAARNPRNMSQLIGPTVAAPTVGVIVPQSLVNYHLRVSSFGDRVDKAHGRKNTPTINSFYTSPDFTTTTLTTVQQRDLIIQNMAYENNKRNDVVNYHVTLCLTDANVAGGTLVSTLATAALGTTIIIGYRKNGVPDTLTIDKSLRQMFADATATIGTLYIQPYHLPSTTPAAPVPIAGTTANCNRLYVIALDEAQAHYDYTFMKKTRVLVGLDTGFETVTQNTVTTSDEGAGQPHSVSLLLRQEYAMSGTENGLPHDGGYFKYPNEFKEDATYDIFRIRYCAHELATNGAPNQTIKEAIIVLLSTEDPTTPYYLNAINPQKTYVRTVLNGFNTQNNLGNPAV